MEEQIFRIGVSPDFYVDAKGKFESVLAERLCVEGVQWEALPPNGGGSASPEVVDHYDALFVLGLRITRESVRNVRRLALVARWGVGYDRIDVDALTEADILLAITPNAVRTPVAESIFTLMLALAKNLFVQDALTRAGKWRGDLPRMGRNLRGQALGSIGFGNIAQEMFRLAQPFGFARLLACDPRPAPLAARELGVELTSMDEVLRASDFVCVNCLLNERTRGLIGESELRTMKSSAYFINTARGPIVREEALIRALQERWIAGAGVDVYEREPPAADHPLFRLDNVIVTPHGLPWTEELARDNGREACGNMLALARGEIPDGVVNRAVLERPGFQAKLARYRRGR
jgi:phosphoglycerate dehydrogenase-like enzyme